MKQNKKNYKGKGKYNPKGYDAKEKFEKNSEKEAFGNDISWYVNDAQMLTDACNLSFANPLSQPIPFSDIGLSNIEPGADTKFVLNTPGVMALRVVPTIGSVLRDGSQYNTGDMWDSAVNMAARAEWSFIRQKNAGAKNYDAPDLMMYHLAMDNIYMYWSWMVRLYGYLRLYSFKNKYYPYGILRAMGLSDLAIADLQGSMADFRTYINLFAAQMSSFAVPINLPYVKRHLWLFQNTFTDASPTKAQVYLYNPEWLYKLEEVTESPMYLSKQDMPDLSGAGFQNPALKRIKAVGDNMISRIVKSESCNIMSGDILKAYEASGIYGFQSISDDFSLLPIYDETVLSQIHNANFYIANTGLTEDDVVIGQDPAIDAGYIYQLIPAGSASPDAVIIDSRFETPTPTDVMYATRLTSVRNADNPYYTDCGSELAVGFTMYMNAMDQTDVLYYGSSQKSNEIYTVNFRSRTGNDITLEDLQKFQEFVANISKFDWHPLIMMRSRLQDTGDAATSIMGNVFGDVDNFAVAQCQTISKMHRVALNSEFGLPYTLTSIK